MPSRSQPDSENTPGCRALNMASSRWACLILRICSSLRLSMLWYPRAAAITVPVVEAIPFVEKIWL